MEDSIMLPSKQSVLTSSPYEDSLAHNGIVHSISGDEPMDLSIDNQSSIMDVRSSPKRKEFKLEIENETEICNNLQNLTKEYVDMTLALNQDTQDILESLTKLSERQKLSKIVNDEEKEILQKLEGDLGQAKQSQKEYFSELDLDIQDYK